LTIKAARRFPEATVFRIDYWGDDWSYSKQQCENNARLEGVSERVVFDKQSASTLDFPDGDFDLVVSCLTFHEVNDAPDKLKAVREAMRVLRTRARGTHRSACRPEPGNSEMRLQLPLP
jgi:ubiquinone/menaquinone biosynthesis C-methylase UbiE